MVTWWQIKNCEIIKRWYRTNTQHHFDIEMASITFCVIFLRFLICRRARQRYLCTNSSFKIFSQYIHIINDDIQEPKSP